MTKEPKKTSLSLDPELYGAAKVCALQEGRSVREVVEAALKAYLAKKHREIIQWLARRHYDQVKLAAAAAKEARHGTR